MKCAIFALSLFFSISIQAMLQSSLSLPSASLIKERLIKKNLQEFDEQTKLSDELGGQRIAPVKIVAHITAAIFLYNKYKRATWESQPNDISLIFQRRSDIIDAILADFSHEKTQIENLMNGKPQNNTVILSHRST